MKEFFKELLSEIFDWFCIGLSFGIIFICTCFIFSWIYHDLEKCIGYVFIVSCIIYGILALLINSQTRRAVFAVVLVIIGIVALSLLLYLLYLLNYELLIDWDFLQCYTPPYLVGFITIFEFIIIAAGIAFFIFMWLSKDDE